MFSILITLDIEMRSLTQIAVRPLRVKGDVDVSSSEKGFLSAIPSVENR